MKSSIPSEFPRSADSTILFRSLTEDELESSLLPFYLSLDFDKRRERFGGVVSDDSIRRHCRQLDLNNVIVLACSGPAGLVAVIELHPLSSGWEESELAIACNAKVNGATVIAHLLQLAAFAAGKRGCTAFVTPSFSSGCDFLELLRRIGRVRVESDAVQTDIGEFVHPTVSRRSPNVIFS